MTQCFTQPRQRSFLQQMGTNRDPQVDNTQKVGDFGALNLK